MENYTNFYPTPDTLLDKILENKVNWKKVKSVLEPSAGKGDICDYVKEMFKAYRNYSEPDIDCIEINEELRKTLKGKEYRVVYDNFLNYHTFKKYDLIVMNPPFNKGCEHLMKALELQKRGGRIICILNAETLHNPCTISRQILLRNLEELNADIQYMQSEFVSAERTTNVEIAVVDVTVPEDEKVSVIFEELKEAQMKQQKKVESITDVAVNDYIKAAIMRFDIEAEAGLKLIREYRAMVPYIMNELKDKSYNHPILEMKLYLGCGSTTELNENKYLEKVRYKYWKALFSDERFTKAMPSNLREDYQERINDLAKYDFSYFNIKEIQIQMCSSLVSGIEDTIIKLFDELSYQHTWSREFSKNIHYYNGWATNKAWFINKKVILPIKCWDDISKHFQYRYDVVEKLRDIEKAFDYLAGAPGRDSWMCGVLDTAERDQRTKNIEMRYFTLTFYKKGTMHIFFKDEQLLKKLNIFGGKNKNMLPLSYGKKHYKDMTEREQSVVMEFDGSESVYEDIMSHPEMYMTEISNDVLQLAG